MWRELLCRYQVSDIASSVYRDRFGCWGFLDLWRTQPAPPFPAADVEFLGRIAGYKRLSACLRVTLRIYGRPPDRAHPAVARSWVTAGRPRLVGRRRAPYLACRTGPVGITGLW